MLGLKHDQNRLVDYDPRWEADFIAERARIANAPGDVAKGIEHYGSTAVEGVRAKPVLDILAGVDPFDDWAKCELPLEGAGYDYAVHAGAPGHPIFGQGRNSSERTHLPHVVDFRGNNWASNLVFRDALRADEKLRAAYVEEKQRAVTIAPQGRREYNDVKHAFITRTKARLIFDVPIGDIS
jgi:GrpB-like predicted nucleotidyltransferase (UPF0157 family)